jgi:RNA polymerase sigma-70 factor (ECF subfamily)
LNLVEGQIADSRNFLPSHDIISSEGFRRELMQDALPALVPDSEATKRSGMNATPGNPDAGKSAAAESDEQLMVAFSLGSTDAFSELFSRYKQPLFGFFRKRVADPAQAEELTQETFLAVLRASSRYESRALFRTYLYAIGFKILRAHRRKTAFRATFLGPAAGVREPALRNAMDAELWLRQAVSKLEHLDREILLLREFEQLRYAEIAELLRLPLNTVRSRLFRARMALRDLLAAPAPKLSPEALTESEGRV